MNTSAGQDAVLGRRRLTKPHDRYHRKEWRRLCVDLDGAAAEQFPDADPGRYQEFKRQVYGFAHFPIGLKIVVASWALGLLAMYLLGVRGIVMFFGIVVIGSIMAVRLNQSAQRKLLNLGEHLGVFAHHHHRKHAHVNAR